MGADRKSDGTRTTALDMAKDAARSVRTSQETRAKLAAAWQHAMYWRCQLGGVTYDLQNYFRHEMQDDGTRKMVKYRDFVGKPVDAPSSSATKED